MSVTGYSLGGHLATAFNLLRREQGQSDHVLATYTFNGAGCGQIAPGASLSQVISQFALQSQNLSGTEIVFASAEMNTLYAELRQLFNGNARYDDISAVLLEAKALIDARYADQASVAVGVFGSPELVTTVVASGDLKQVVAAINRVQRVLQEGGRVDGLANNGAPPADIPAASVAATRLDYQMAVLIAEGQTSAFSTAAGAANTAFDGRHIAPNLIANLHDIYGATYPSAVANSQMHYGTATPVFIEDQPLYRGNVGTDVVQAS